MKTIVGLFDTIAEAKQAAIDIEAAGIAHNDISFVANNETGAYASNDSGTGTGTQGVAPTVTGHAIGHDAKVGAEVGAAAGLVIGLTGLAIPGLGWIATAGWLMGTVMGAATGAVVGGLVGALTHVGVPAEDAAHYNEGVRRGGTLVAVKSSDELAYKVAEILGEDGAVDIDERASQYATTGYVAPAAATTFSNTSTAVSSGTTIPVVEEELVVGKREVQGGGIRVYTHVTERPVEETVTLREEHVTVDRQPVNRAATAGDLNAGEHDFTITESREVPVVVKEARVVEEVTIGKQASEHTETVTDTVRRTDVDVETIDSKVVGDSIR